MVNGALQTIGFVVTLLGWIMAIVTTFMPTWRKSDLQGEVIEAIRSNNGLWSRCTSQATGYRTCDDYDAFFLGLPVPLQAARALACLSIFLGLLGAIVCGLGMECTSVASGNPKMKSRMVMVAGVFHVLGGVCIGSAVSWFAANILQEYYNNLPIIQNQKYVYGDALFVGWASMAFSIIAGLVLCCASWNSEDEDHGRSYHYNPPSKPKASAAEYI